MHFMIQGYGWLVNEWYVIWPNMTALLNWREEIVSYTSTFITFQSISPHFLLISLGVHSDDSTPIYDATRKPEMFCIWYIRHKKLNTWGMLLLVISKWVIHHTNYNFRMRSKAILINIYMPLSCLWVIWMAIIRSGWVLRPRTAMELRPLTSQQSLVAISWLSAQPMHVVEHMTSWWLMFLT